MDRDKDSKMDRYKDSVRWIDIMFVIKKIDRLVLKQLDRQIDIKIVRWIDEKLEHIF